MEDELSAKNGKLFTVGTGDDALGLKSIEAGYVRGCHIRDSFARAILLCNVSDAFAKTVYEGGNVVERCPILRKTTDTRSSTCGEQYDSRTSSSVNLKTDDAFWRRRGRRPAKGGCSKPVGAKWDRWDVSLSRRLLRPAASNAALTPERCLWTDGGQHV